MVLVDPCISHGLPVRLLLCVAITEVKSEESHASFQVLVTLYQMAPKAFSTKKFLNAIDDFACFNDVRATPMQALAT
jgi:hypothetical protein